MSKLRCKCGHVIADVTDNIPYKGYILPDVEVNNVSDAHTDNINSLLEAIKDGKRAEWISNNFLPGYPTDLSESEMIHDLLTSHLVKTTQDIYECEDCGRIWIQLGETNQFKSFSPDTNDTKGILNSKK